MITLNKAALSIIAVILIIFISSCNYKSATDTTIEEPILTNNADVEIDSKLLNMTTDNNLSAEYNEQKNNDTQEPYVTSENKMNDYLLNILGSETYLFWDHSKGMLDSKTEVDLFGKSEKNKVIFGYDNPNGMKLLIELDNIYQNIFYLGMQPDNMLNEFGEIKDGFSVQVGFFDFDNDNQKEILLVIGDKISLLNIAVYKIDSSNQGHSIRQVAYSSGYRSIIVDKDGRVRLPYGSQGLYDEIIIDTTNNIQNNTNKKENVISDDIVLDIDLYIMQLEKIIRGTDSEVSTLYKCYEIVSSLNQYLATRGVDRNELVTVEELFENAKNDFSHIYYAELPIGIGSKNYESQLKNSIIRLVKSIEDAQFYAADRDFPSLITQLNIIEGNISRVNENAIRLFVILNSLN